MTDIKIKRYADKENLKKLMRYLKNTFVNKSEIKELIDQSGDGKPSSLKIDLIRFVSTLPDPDAAEEGVLYFVPTDIAGEYDLYAKENVDGTPTMVRNSSISISGDLEGLLTKEEAKATYFNEVTVDNATVTLSRPDGSTVPVTVDNVASADKATNDGNGNSIVDTYETKADAEEEYISTATSEDDTITLSRPDGSTVVITVNNVEHATKADQDGNGYVIADTYATKTELDSKANTSDLSAVATTGSYNDLLDIPTSFDVDATKLATARTIALSGAATGTATAFDGSDDITIPVTALDASAIREQWYAAYPDGPEAHNAMWGGRDITAAFDAGTVSEHIADGTFKDIFPGDYITKQVTIPKVLADDGTTLFYGNTYDVDWVVADCDYWLDAPHHVVIVPRLPIFEARMNATNTTEGGYAGSEMYKKIIPACAKSIVNAFGSSHILTFRDYITNSVDTEHVSSGIPQYMGTPGWWGEQVEVQCNLMSEKMVYGAPICAAGAMDNAMALRQMSAFRLSSLLISDPIFGRSWWLRDVVSSSNFAAVHSYPFVGVYAFAYAASEEQPENIEYPRVRPFAMLM